MKLKFYLCKKEKIIENKQSENEIKNNTNEETSENIIAAEEKPTYKDIYAIKKKPIFVCDSEDIDAKIFNEKIHEAELKEIFNEDDLNEIGIIDAGYKIQISDIRKASKNKGFVTGYASKKDVKTYYKKREENEEIRFAHEEMEMLPIETFVEFDDKKRAGYEKFSYLDTYSKGYLYNILNNILFDTNDNYIVFAFVVN